MNIMAQFFYNAFEFMNTPFLKILGFDVAFSLWDLTQVAVIYTILLHFIIKFIRGDD